MHIWSIIATLLLLEQLLVISEAANLSQMVKKQAQQQQQQQQKAGQALTTAQQQQQQQQQQPQQGQTQGYVHEAEILTDQQQELKSEEDEEHDAYQMLQELKQDSRLPAWNPFVASVNPYESMPQQRVPPPPALPMPKMLPFIGYAQPLLIPVPLYIAPDMFYPAYPGASNDLDDVVMSRAAGDRRPSVQGHPSQSRNSPIYYVRLPPTPYMFVPNMAPGAFGSGFSPLLTYQPMPSFSTFGSVFNLPVNFLSNGKPSGIYQMNDMTQFTPGLGGGSFGMRPPTPSNPFRHPMTQSSPSYGHTQQTFGLASLPSPQQDSKLTSLKRPFVFNGRPEDIYILPNSLSPIYNDQSYY
ncbi:uncharacterized protein Dwil_GK12981 [Drosophila willistoni]|uniref:Uncharacterized protein n=1 Tax=Drosophila willistoni TaxID=7260 RepID=B4NI31_DROWI|nr:histone-lysine N-methyltransferase 2D [Drosophila willistoni]EDW84723.1 uncharacterized protein Dwil_GK12981 [Drosophila willistoni]